MGDAWPPLISGMVTPTAPHSEFLRITHHVHHVCMQNYKLTIQYDGTNYHGWQVQPNGRTIQGELTRVLSLLDKREVRVHGAGRTDAGVHAEGQVASLLLARPLEPLRLRDAINGNLERDLRVIGVEGVAESFHARFAAREKTYRYRLVVGEVMSPFLNRYALHHRRALDVDAMRRAAATVIGTHDFSAFTVVDSERESHVRTLKQLEVQADGELISIYATADGFLRYMVRNLVGTLLEIGRGERPLTGMREVLEGRDRTRAGATAKPHGLTLMRVAYDR
jgi:tRNA pseudouridine38-40 synthase